MFRKSLQQFFLIVILLSSLSGKAATPYDTPRVDDDRIVQTLDSAWWAYLFLNLQYNIRAVPPLPAAIWPVYHFDIPFNLKLLPAGTYGALMVKTFMKDSRPFIVKRDGEYYRRFYFVHQPNLGIGKLNLFDYVKKYFGEPVADHYGVKLQSKNTFFVWNAGDKTQAPFELKLQVDHEEDGTKPSIVNHSENGAASLGATRLIEQLMAEKTPETFVPVREPLYTVIHLPRNKEYTMIVRELTREANLDPIPLHAFLASPLLDQAAKAMGLTTDQWLRQEYIPKFTRFLIESHFDFGIYFPVHTQNLFVSVDSGGSIQTFHPKDMNDVFFDPVIIAKKFSKKIFHSLMNTDVIHLLHRKYDFIGMPKSGLPEFNVFQFAIQSLQFDFHSLTLQTALLIEFMTTYESLLVKKLNPEKTEDLSPPPFFKQMLNELLEKAKRLDREFEAAGIDQKDSLGNYRPEVTEFYQETEVVFTTLFEPHFTNYFTDLALQKLDEFDGELITTGFPQIGSHEIQRAIELKLIFPTASFVTGAGTDQRIYTNLEEMLSRPAEEQTVTIFTLGNEVLIFHSRSGILLGWIPDMSRFKEHFSFFSVDSAKQRSLCGM